MERMRDVLRGSLRRSLSSLTEEDRVAAAWHVACGAALAGRGEPVYIDESQRLHVRVLEARWMEPFERMRAVLASDISRVSGVRLSGIVFELNLQQRAGPQLSGVNER